MANRKITANRRFELFANILVAILTGVAIALFAMSYTTNYYTFGQMNSGLIALNMCGALVFAILSTVLCKKYPEKLWPKFITYGTTALLCYSMIALLGDRVEAIGTTIVTDYDSGHGGEEAIYYSIGSILLMLVALVFNIIGSFEKREPKGKGTGKRVLSAIIACALCLCVVGVTLNMTGVLRLGATGGNGGATADAKIYTVSYNQGNGNTDEEIMPDYQFLCSDFSGMVRSDSRFYVDVALTLDGAGNYTLFTDSYVVESGNRAEVGDDTGLGLVLTMNAEGAYTENDDGTITTAVPNHAVFEMQTDTYSSQMKSAAQMNVNGNDADGVYDSNDEPAVLDFVPETIWTLNGDKTIAGWVSAAEDEEPAEEEAPAGEAVDKSAEQGGVTVASDDSGTEITFNPDGSYRFYFASYDIEDLGTYTYEDGTLTLVNAAGAEATADGDPMKLHYVSSVNEALAGDYTIPASTFDFGAGEEEASAGDEATEQAKGVVIPSDDQGTTMTFFPDGTYRFDFESYSIVDEGTYTYADGALTVTDANGKQSTAEGDPMHLHYEYSQSDQLTGDYTIPASTFAFNAGDGESSAKEEASDESAQDGVTVASDDGGTEITFNPDGTYRFFFASYNVEDLGTYTYENGELTLVNVNGTEATAEGDPLKLHYVSAVSDALTGDYTIPAETFER